MPSKLICLRSRSRLVAIDYIHLLDSFSVYFRSKRLNAWFDAEYRSTNLQIFILKIMMTSTFIKKKAYLALVHEFMGRLELAKQVEDSIPASKKSEFYTEIVRQYDRVYMETFDAKNNF